MNDFLIEFLRISLGVIVGGALATPFKVIKIYNSTQMSIAELELKLDALNRNLILFDKWFLDHQIKSEGLELSIESLNQRLARLEGILEGRKIINS